MVCYSVSSCRDIWLWSLWILTLLFTRGYIIAHCEAEFYIIVRKFASQIIGKKIVFFNQVFGPIESNYVIDSETLWLELRPTINTLLAGWKGRPPPFCYSETTGNARLRCGAPLPGNVRKNTHRGMHSWAVNVRVFVCPLLIRNELSSIPQKGHGFFSLLKWLKSAFLLQRGGAVIKR